jgi:hypothetical protein
MPLNMEAKFFHGAVGKESASKIISQPALTFTYINHKSSAQIRKA